MKKILFLIPFILLLISSSCAGQKEKAKIKRLLIFPPLTEINIIATGNKAELDTTLSKKVRLELISKTIALLEDSVKLIPFNGNDFQLQEVNKAIAHTLSVAENIYKPKKIDAPALLLNLLDSANEDYGLCIANVGFIRTAENEVKEFSKAAGINLFTIAAFNLRLKVNNSLSSMACFIVNRKQKTLHFYLRSNIADSNPVNPIFIKSQLRHLLMSYFL
jgi:hypothetical protein